MLNVEFPEPYFENKPYLTTTMSKCKLLWCYVLNNKTEPATEIDPPKHGWVKTTNYLSTSGSTPRDISTSIIFFITAPCRHGWTDACFPGKWGWSSIVTYIEVISHQTQSYHIWHTKSIWEIENWNSSFFPSKFNVYISNKPTLYFLYLYNKIKEFLWWRSQISKTNFNTTTIPQ